MENAPKPEHKSKAKLIVGIVVGIIIICIIIAVVVLTFPSTQNTIGGDGTVPNKGTTPVPVSGATVPVTAPAPATTTPPAATNTPIYSQYKGKNSGKCLNILGGTGAQGEVLGIWNCDTANEDNTKFYYNPTTQELKIKSTGMCVDVAGGYTGQGGGIQAYLCNNTPAQQWTYNNNMFKNVGSGRCFNVSGDSKDDGAHVITWDCDPNAGNEIWTVV
jgi:hypothetical protein